jgi:lactoylglutathione lyase
MKFCWCTIHVRDLEESLKFYQEVVGLKLARRFGPPAMEIAFLDGEGAQVELICDGQGKKPDIGADISLGFEVASLDDKLLFMGDKGIPVHSGPFAPNPHVRFFYVLDPNGLKIQFVQNIK